MKSHIFTSEFVNCFCLILGCLVMGPEHIMDCGGHIRDQRSSYGSQEVKLRIVEVKLWNVEVKLRIGGQVMDHTGGQDTDHRRCCQNHHSNHSE